MNTKNDRTILCWNDRKIVVEHVTMDADMAASVAQDLAKTLGEPDCWQVLPGHLSVQTNEASLRLVLGGK